MFELDIEMLKEQGLQLVDSAKKTAQDLAAPAEEPAAEKTVESEETIEEEPVHLRGETKICPVCKAEVDGDAMFCNHCGAQL